METLRHVDQSTNDQSNNRRDPDRSELNNALINQI
jgi:hypothetical protein